MPQSVLAALRRAWTVWSRYRSQFLRRHLCSAAVDLLTQVTAPTPPR
eukprot:COSAG01_NODE_1757_length_9317_cov_3.510089_6_plen_47_part_00